MFTFFSMLNVFISLTLLVQVVVALLLILVVLMQRPKQEGLGATFGAGMTDQMFGAQTTNVLQKATVWFGITFFVTTLLLAILTTKKNTSAAIVSDAPAAAETVSGNSEASTPSLADQLTQAEANANNATAPQVVTPAPEAAATTQPAATTAPAQKTESESLLDQLNNAQEVKEEVSQ